MRISKQKTRHEEQPLMSQTGAVALMPVLGQSRAWEQLEEADACAPLSDCLQPEGEDHPTGICPGAGLTVCESTEVEQGREMLLDWKHPVLSPWHTALGIIVSRAHDRSIGKGSPRPWSVRLVGQTHPIEGCPQRPSITLTHGPPKQAPSFGYSHSDMQRPRVQAVKGCIINVRKTTELRKNPKTRKPQHWVRHTHAYMVTHVLRMDATPWL